MIWNSLGGIVAFCVLLDFGPSSEVLGRLAIESTYGDKYKVAEYNQQLTLTCNVNAKLLEDTEDPTYNWKWFKGNDRSKNQITADFDKVFQIDVFENTLTFNRFIGSNAGLYTCKLFNDDNGSLIDKKVISVALKPYVNLPTTATFNEGDQMELECIVYGVPTPEISWKFENTTLEPSDQVTFLPDMITNISNAVLVLNPVTAENSGNYYCSGISSAVSQPVISNPSNVIIKGKEQSSPVQDQTEWLVAVDLAERRAAAAERRAVMAEQRAVSSEQRAAVAERRASMTEQRAEMAEKRATLAEKRAVLFEQRAIMAEQKQKNGPPPITDTKTE